jgi:hypothetical protein
MTFVFGMLGAPRLGVKKKDPISVQPVGIEVPL